MSRRTVSHADRRPGNHLPGKLDRIRRDVARPLGGIAVGDSGTYISVNTPEHQRRHERIVVRRAVPAIRRPISGARTRPACSCQPVEKGLLSVAEAAKTLGLHRSTVYRMLEDGQLPLHVFRVGNVVKLSSRQIDRWLETGQGIDDSKPGITDAVKRSKPAATHGLQPSRRSGRTMAPCITRPAVQARPIAPRP